MLHLVIPQYISALAILTVAFPPIAQSSPAKSVFTLQYPPKRENKKNSPKKLTSSRGMPLTSASGSREMNLPIILSTSDFSQSILG